MAWGCKPESKPNGCGWAYRLTYREAGYQEWWCDLCERSGDLMVSQTADSDPAPSAHTSTEGTDV